jgi:hypothetical protein
LGRGKTFGQERRVDGMKVTALIVAYNHAKYLATAIAGALAQKTQFDFEIVVADDCSTDGTTDILRQWERLHPEKIRGIYRQRNVGAIANSLNAIPGCRGEYVAMLEGDDRWTCPEKLQRQVDFLDAHPDCSACCHAVNYVHEDGSEPPRRFPETARPRSTLENVLTLTANFHTSSMVFRRRLFLAAPDWLREQWIGDWPKLMLLAEQGDIGFLDEVMSEYRIHPHGLWSSSSDLRRNEGMLQVFQCARRHLGRRCSMQTANLVAARTCSVSRDLEQVGRKEESRRRLLDAVAVLMEESPPDEPSADSLCKNSRRVLGMFLDLPPATDAALPSVVADLKAQLARSEAELRARTEQLTSLSNELSLVQNSRWWRLRRLAVSLWMPWRRDGSSMGAGQCELESKRKRP